MRQLIPIDAWVKDLEKIPERDFTIPRVREFIQENPVQPETLAPYLFYAKSHYTRNLIHKCDLFEVLTICWDSGQVSRIHNHRGQNCWMSVPIGRLRVQNFRVVNRDAARSTCCLVPTTTYDMDPEHPAHVSPEEPVHQVLNLAAFRGRATSIHIYSHPYSSCEIYSLEKSSYSDVELFYTSEYGKLSPDEKLF